MYRQVLPLLLLLNICHSSSACITQEECTASIHDALVTYDHRHSHLEYTLARHLYDISIELSEKIMALNSKMIKGPAQCQHFLESTLQHYIKVLNGTCKHEHHKHIPHDIWEKFQALNPHFFDATDADEVRFVCDIVVSVLRDFCAVVQEQIDALLACDFLEKFDKIFVNPYMDCVTQAYS